MKTLKETGDDHTNALHEIEAKVLDLLVYIQGEKRIHHNEIEKLQAEVERWKEIAQR
jgi:hypothetical protein